MDLSLPTLPDIKDRGGTSQGLLSPFRKMGLRCYDDKVEAFWSNLSSMKKGYSPLAFGLVLASLSAFLWYLDASQNHEAELLASEIKTFLESHRTESSDHRIAFQQARQLSLSIQSPSRIPLIMLSLVMAVMFFTVFCQSPKGKMVKQKFSRAWTWRP